MKNRRVIKLVVGLLAVTAGIGLQTRPVSAESVRVRQLKTFIQAMDKQVEGNPLDTNLLLQRGSLHMYLDEDQAAIDDFTHVLSVDGKNSAALAARAQTYLYLGKGELALADIDAAISLTPANKASYLVIRAAALYILKRDKEALACYTEAFENFPALSNLQKMMVLADRAELYYRLEDYPHCLADCKAVIAIDPRGCGGSAYYWQGQAMTRLGDAAAQASLDKAAELGYSDSGRAVVRAKGYTYPYMFDSVQKLFSHRLDTKHFAFFYNSDEKIAEDMAKFSELFISRIDSDLFKIDWDHPVNVYMMPDRESQTKFLKEQMHYNYECFGTSIEKRNALVFYTTSGIGTAGHIVSGQAAKSLATPDSFTGFYAFFEKVYGCQFSKSPADSVLYWGFQNPWRLEKVQDKLPDLTLAEVVDLSNDRTTDHQSEERLVAIFLYQQGKFKQYVDLVAAGDLRGFPTYFEAVFNKSMAEIEPQWHEYLIKVKKDIEILKQTPLSQFFTNKKEFDDFVRSHSDTLQNIENHRSDRSDPVTP